jgi:ATP-dependent Clp protease, protease subunit
MKWKMQRKATSNDVEFDSPKIISIGKSINNDFEDNKIYFYEEVTRESILNLNQQIDEATKSMKILQIRHNLSEPPPIELHICSEGGDAMSCMASVDKISGNSVPIHTYIEGFAASAATLMSVVGQKRFITKNSSMLVHQLSSEMWGTYANFKDEIKNLELLMDTIRQVYLQHTKFKKDDLEEILSHDLFFGAEECLKRGLVDQVI